MWKLFWANQVEPITSFGFTGYHALFQNSQTMFQGPLEEDFDDELLPDVDQQREAAIRLTSDWGVRTAANNVCCTGWGVGSRCWRTHGSGRWTGGTNQLNWCQAICLYLAKLESQPMLRHIRSYSKVNNWIGICYLSTVVNFPVRSKLLVGIIISFLVKK